MSANKANDPVNMLTSFNKNGGDITRKDHSHPAAYALLHVESEQMYVGSTNDLYTRVNKHHTRLLAGEHRNKNMQEAFNQDERFSLAFVRTETKEAAIEIEQKMLDTFMPTGRLLNISPDARVANKGVSLSDAAKNKLRQGTIQQFSTQEARDRHSQISKDLWSDPDYQRRQQEGMAKVDVEKRSARLSESIQEKWNDPEYRAKMSERPAWSKNAVTIDGVEYPSAKDAADALHITRNALYSRIRSTSAQFAGCYYSTEKETSK